MASHQCEQCGEDCDCGADTDAGESCRVCEACDYHNKCCDYQIDYPMDLFMSS